MHKKQKNIKKKEAIKKRQNSENLVNSLNMDLSDETLSIVIILKDLTLNQLTNLCFTEVNKACKDFAGIDIGIMSHDSGNHPMLLCPILNLQLIKQLKYPIISTNISTTLTALSSKSNRIYYYIFDIESIPLEIKNSKKITFVAKDKNTSDILTRMYDVEKINIVENFSMINFIKLINEDIKNEEKRNI